MPSQEVEDAIARVLRGRPRGNCWASRLPEGGAREFLAGLEALEEDPKLRISRVVAAEEFVRWGVEVTDNAISKHLLRKCGCRPKR